MEDIKGVIENHIEPLFQDRTLYLKAINLMEVLYFDREIRDEMGRFLMSERSYMIEGRKIHLSLFGEVSKGPEGVKWRIFAEENHKPLLASSLIMTFNGSEGKNWPFILLLENSFLYIKTSDTNVSTYWVRFKTFRKRTDPSKINEREKEPLL